MFTLLIACAFCLPYSFHFFSILPLFTQPLRPLSLAHRTGNASQVMAALRNLTITLIHRGRLPDCRGSTAFLLSSRRSFRSPSSSKSPLAYAFENSQTLDSWPLWVYRL